MRTAARVFAAIKRFEALKSPFPRVPFSRRLTNPRLTPMEPALSGKPVNVYGTFVVAAMGLGVLGPASVSTLLPPAAQRAAPWNH
jgi:hypothetical protein